MVQVLDKKAKCKSSPEAGVLGSELEAGEVRRGQQWKLRPGTLVSLLLDKQGGWVPGDVLEQATEGKGH